MLAVAGLTARGELSAQTVEILLNPYGHPDVVLAAFSGSDPSEADLYAFAAEMLAANKSTGPA